MNGSIPMFLLTTFAFVFSIFEGKLKVFITMCLLIHSIILLIFEYYNPHWVTIYSSSKQGFTGHLFAFVMSIPLITIAIGYFQLLYESEKLSNKILIEQYRQSSQYLRQQANNQLLALSTREREVFELIIEGKSNKVIADSLNVELGTIKTHINNIYKKLDVKSRSEISKFWND